jgi:NAD(P)-dependent dehydrogenase (short-subunit alcohol dehydrogenase family)
MLDNTAEKYSGEAVKKIEAQQLLGLGEPEDVANTVVFFLSDASRWITASNLIVGGG